jgi:hypothetical protein
MSIGITGATAELWAANAESTANKGFLKLHPPKWWITLWMNLRPTAEVCKVLAIFMNFW